MSKTSNGMVTFSVATTEKTHRALARLAKKNQRSLAAEARLAFEAWLEKQKA